ncbi:hypothetical protein LSH36_1862g00029 [Paralvinella palmiformis]|uniref:Uncharacterized protein n=1 Tax=Paralvinella palmiformis TaxID=53620 RepID=A0AAD9MMP9_9ANNE|nr:hypothetical protein LSH36_1862g00029 [Paralvinella palmiformis]
MVAKALLVVIVLVACVAMATAWPYDRYGGYHPDYHRGGYDHGYGNPYGHYGGYHDQRYGGGYGYQPSGYGGYNPYGY